MRTKPRAIHRPLASQLSLGLPSLRVPPVVADPLQAVIAGSPPPDRLVLLRCPACRFQQALRVVPGGGPGRPLPPRLPAVPVRHWVFSLGPSVQPALQAHPRLRARVARACMTAAFAVLRRCAAHEGVPEPWRCGGMTAIHRVGAALDANVHVHALVLDGVYAPRPAGPPCFHPLPAPRPPALRRMLAELRQAVAALVARAEALRSAWPAPPRSSAGEVLRVAAPPRARPMLEASQAVACRVGELDVHAGAPVAPDDHALRARLCRYVARPPFDPAALEPGRAGRLRYRLHHPLADGTTHVELSPRALAGRLRALAMGELRPPVAFHGVLAPAAARSALGASPAQQLALLEPAPRTPRARPATPALPCPRCQAALEVVRVEPAPVRA